LIFRLKSLSRIIQTKNAIIVSYVTNHAFHMTNLLIIEFN